MNTFFEMGIAITICLISASAFLNVFGAPGELNVIGFNTSTPTGSELSASDINAIASAGSGIAKSGAAYDSSPGVIGLFIEGWDIFFNKILNMFTGYSQVLYAIMPVALHPVITIIVGIFTFIQGATMIYLLLTGLSLLRGGGFGG